MGIADWRKNKLYPGSWPIAVKLAVALVVAALLPMLLVSYYNLQQGLALAATAEAQKLEQLAANKGARIDQMIKDTQHTIAYFGWSEEVIRLVAAPLQPRRALVSKSSLLKRSLLSWMRLAIQRWNCGSSRRPRKAVSSRWL